MKLSANFYLNEFVPRKIYERFTDKSVQFIDMRLVHLAQYMRDYFGVGITINDWVDGGRYNESGFRDPQTGTGAVLSQHKFGRAIDCKFSGKTPQEIYEYIMANQQQFYDKGLRCLEAIEKTPTWLHCDIRETSGYGIGAGNILIVKP